MNCPYENPAITDRRYKKGRGGMKPLQKTGGENLAIPAITDRPYRQHARVTTLMVVAFAR